MKSHRGHSPQLDNKNGIHKLFSRYGTWYSYWWNDKNTKRDIKMGDPTLDDWSHAVPGIPNLEKRNVALAKVHAEVSRSYELYGCPLWGRHEAYAIIKEELDEIWDAIRADAPFKDLEKELIQTAAMCIRYLETEVRLLPLP